MHICPSALFSTNFSPSNGKPVFSLLILICKTSYWSVVKRGKEEEVRCWIFLLRSGGSLSCSLHRFCCRLISTSCRATLKPSCVNPHSLWMLFFYVKNDWIDVTKLWIISLLPNSFFFPFMHRALAHRLHWGTVLPKRPLCIVLFIYVFNSPCFNSTVL